MKWPLHGFGYAAWQGVASLHFPSARRAADTTRGRAVRPNTPWGRRHLERVLNRYVRHYNDQRPQRGPALRPPRIVDDGPVLVLARSPRPSGGGTVSKALIHEYYQPQHGLQSIDPTGHLRDRDQARSLRLGSPSHADSEAVGPQRGEDTGEGQQKGRGVPTLRVGELNVDGRQLGLWQTGPQRLDLALAAVVERLA
jgi:hypothetical protein